jgi:hypothetical protein
LVALDAPQGDGYSHAPKTGRGGKPGDKDARMVRWTVPLLAMTCCLLIGCLGRGAPRQAVWMERFRPQPRGIAGPDVVWLDVALLERPVGDHQLNRDVWEAADEQVVPQDRKALLLDNGFRVGVIGGIVPSCLQALLGSERSCVNPRRIQLHAATPTTLHLGPTVPLIRCEAFLERGPKLLELEEARCGLEATPSPGRDGRTKVRFTPVVQHGRQAIRFRPADDRSGWETQVERPVERFDDLAWEVELALDEFVLVGGLYDQLDTLGNVAFVRPDETPAAVQRLLVVRTYRPAEDVTALSAAETASPDRRSPSLARQAQWSTVRDDVR